MNVVLDPFNVNQRLYSGSYRFSLCPIIDTIKDIVTFNTDTNYIIATGVSHAPDHWTGSKYSEIYHIGDYTNENIPNLFDLLSPKYQQDLKNGSALLLLDQSHEGYHRQWIWQWLHEECVSRGISPRAIILVVGDQSAHDQYKVWLADNPQTETVKVITATTLKDLVLQRNIFSNIFTPKKAIKLYDCINKHHRLHRIYNFLHLVKADLVDDGIISMDTITRETPPDELRRYGISTKELSKANSMLPLWIDEPNNTRDFIYYETRVLSDLYRKTWVSVVTEASYFDYENSIFISEKVFKPMLCLQPFIIVGSKGTLKKLRDLGYKTFNGWIDERYDECDDKERFVAIVDALKQIKEIEDKEYWYESMRDILEYNYNLISSLRTKNSPEHIQLINYYNEYFNV